MEMDKVEKNTKRMLSKLMLRDEHDDGESSESEADSDEEEEEKYISSEEFKTWVFGWKLWLVIKVLSLGSNSTPVRLSVA